MARRFQYYVRPTAMGDTIYADTLKEAVKEAKKAIKEQTVKETCFIDVFSYEMEELANFWYTVTVEGKLQKH